jgi:hypothetical protein
MRHLPLVARLLLGFIMFASGLAGLLNLLPVLSCPGRGDREGARI